jgi:hypothetical protein
LWLEPSLKASPAGPERHFAGVLRQWGSYTPMTPGYTATHGDFAFFLLETELPMPSLEAMCIRNVATNCRTNRERPRSDFLQEVGAWNASPRAPLKASWFAAKICAT